MGEVGAEGVDIAEHHQALHAALARLAREGVLVCLCSKNDETDVERVFETRRDLGLRRDAIVAAMINWQPKSENLRALAARLNLGLDSFVFIDNSPVECAEVRAGCPETLTLQWPQDSQRARLLLEHLWEIDPENARRRTFGEPRATARSCTGASCRKRHSRFATSLRVWGSLLISPQLLKMPSAARRSSRSARTSLTSRRFVGGG